MKNAKTKMFIYYLGGAAIGFLLWCTVAASKTLMDSLLINFFVFCFGTALGLFGKPQFEKRPWLLLFFPGLLLVLGIFV